MKTRTLFTKADYPSNASMVQHPFAKFVADKLMDEKSVDQISTKKEYLKSIGYDFSDNYLSAKTVEILSMVIHFVSGMYYNNRPQFYEFFRESAVKKLIEVPEDELPLSNCGNCKKFVVQAWGTEIGWCDTKHSSNSFEGAKLAAQNLLNDDSAWLSGRRAVRITKAKQLSGV